MDGGLVRGVKRGDFEKFGEGLVACFIFFFFLQRMERVVVFHGQEEGRMKTERGI